MNIIKGTSSNDTLSGTDAPDRIYGYAGSDILDGDAGNDELDGGAGNDELDGGAGKDVLYGGAGNDELYGGAGKDVLYGGAGKDVLYGGAGNDVLYGGSVNDMLDGGNGNVVLDGGAGNDVLYGSWGNDELDGGAGNDVLYGSWGNDELDGGSGNDELNGGWGNDTYLFGIGSGQDTVYDYSKPSGNRDTIQLGNGIAPTDVIISRGISDLTIKINGTFDQLTLPNWFVSDADKIEQVKFADGTLWDVDALLANLTYRVATDDDDYLAGDSGANTLSGLKGNDIYLVDHVGDKVKEKQNEGYDTVEAKITYKLAANVENLALTGNAAINGSGNALNNRIGGNSADNTLNGGVGDDHLTSAGGNDILNGGVGEDFLDGGSGNDTYLFGIGSGQDRVSEYDATPGNLDTIQLGNGIATTDVTIVRGIDNLTIKIKGTADQLTLSDWFLHDVYKIEQVKFADGTLWDVADLLANLVDFATDGDDYLAGDSGANTLSGLKGNDLYIVDHAGDEVKERLNEGADTVEAKITYKLAANVENLELTGSAAINGTGNALSNVIFGNGNNNILDGGAGNDALFGGYGNDVLNGGADNDVLLGDDGNDVLDGGLGDDVLNGGDGNDVLDGGVGDDVLDGGFGDDTYLFGIGSGHDSVLIYDDNFFGFGNPDTIQLGNGIAPTDVTIVRGIRNLTIKINGTTDQLTLSDWFASDADKSEQVKFADGTLWDAAALLANHTGLATDGDDYLAGDSGANTLSGLKGNDIYLVDHAGDEVTEKMNEGADRVDAEITYKLAANVENLKLTGSAAINGTGNALNNSIYGNIANNILSGGLGDDVLKGDSGNDILNGGAGNDGLYSSKYVYYDNFEIRDDSGNDILNGGAGDDELVAGFGNDILNGGAGDDLLNSEYYWPPNWDKGGKGINKLNGSLAIDVLNGGAGNDRLTDGTGDDILNGGPGDDDLNQGTGNDILNGGAGNDDLGFTVFGWSYYLGTGDDILNGGVGNDSLYGGDDNDILKGDAGKDYLNGGYDNDILNGGGGDDTLEGGAGDDIFQLTTFSTDTISDFSIDNDTIQLDINVFTQLPTSGPLNAANFIKGAVAADTNDYVIYNKVTGELFYDADGSDPGAAEQIALLGTGSTHPDLTFADFIVI